MDVLQQEGSSTQVAINGIEAVRIAGHKAIDLAIVDLGLPDMDGREAATAHGFPVILLSGSPLALFNRLGELQVGWRFLKKLLDQRITGLSGRAGGAGFVPWRH